MTTTLQAQARTRALGPGRVAVTTATAGIARDPCAPRPPRAARRPAAMRATAGGRIETAAGVAAAIAAIRKA